jgi:uncharacterized protein
MDGLNFTWDKRKAQANLKKHGVSFEEAKSVFFDEYARLILDPDHPADEERFILLGFSLRLRLLVVCHCYREEEDSVRIISARKAERSEQRQYEGYRHES